jgi:GAF domain-containing protein
LNSVQQDLTLAEVDILPELLARPQRPPDYDAEREALAELAKETAENPHNMLQKLAEIAVRLCVADTAGISLMEGDAFRWEAMAGASAAYRDGVLPRDASPCGICINRDATQLMRLPARFFPAIQLAPLIHEVLLVPFHVLGKPVGTVWILAQNPERKFGSEDERIIRTLAQFASTGWQLWKAYEAAVDAARRKDDFMAMLGHELRNPLTDRGVSRDFGHEKG